jgi:hypothetical protein
MRAKVRSARIVVLFAVRSINSPKARRFPEKRIPVGRGLRRMDVAKASSANRRFEGNAGATCRSNTTPIFERNAAFAGLREGINHNGLG